MSGAEAWSLDPLAAVAILGMAAVTYAMRAGGFWLMRWMPMSRGMEAWLRHIPGAILVALVAPMVAAGGWPELAGVAAAIVVMRVTRQDVAAIAAGILTVALLRAL